MRRILVASLLSTFALAAAAATPKPPGNGAVPTVATTCHPVSTGVTGPELYSSAVINIPADTTLDQYPNPAEVLLRVNLDADGKTTRIRVLRSISPTANAYVVSAVRQFRWRPAELDNQNIPVAVNILVKVQH
jgi:TonB family protein